MKLYIGAYLSNPRTIERFRASIAGKSSPGVSLSTGYSMHSHEVRELHNATCAVLRTFVLRKMLLDFVSRTIIRPTVIKK